MFPRVPGWRDPVGLQPVRALNTRATRIGSGLRVVVSVLRGRQSHETEEAIGTFDVAEHHPVTVEELRRVGLLPVTYSIKPFAAPVLQVPQGSSRVEGLAIDGIEPVLDPVPAYRITVRNRTDIPVVTLAFTAYRGGADALSGQQGDAAARPIVAPGETFTFTLKIPGGRPAAQPFATVQPLDDFAITGALWADGRTGGDPRRAGMLAALHRGRLRALDAVVPALREAGAATDGDAIGAMRRLRDTLVAVPSALDDAAVARAIRDVPALGVVGPTEAAAIMAAGAQDARRRMIPDIDRVLASATPALARQWLSEARDACEAWHARLSALFAARP